MKSSTQLFAALIGAFASSAALAGGGYLSISNTAVHPERAGAYWTAERRAKAKTFLPRRDAGAIQAQSFGTANLDFTRSRIWPQTANKAEGYRAVGKLYFTIPGEGDFQCSASVIKKRLVVTAAHCMYSDGVGFHTNWQFIPGFDGTAATEAPYGYWNWSYAIVPENWIDTHGDLPNNTDFGILELVDQATGGRAVKPIGRTVGTLAAKVGHLFDTHVTMLGYPCNFDDCLRMQRNDSSDVRGTGVTGSTAYEYGSDMTGGSSGGPWVENFGDPAAAAPTGSGFKVRNTVVAVTSYGYTDENVKILGASQFNDDFTSILTTACDHQAGNC